MNETLDAVIGPLNVAAEYVDRISKGDIPPKITDSYNGDFNEIKNNLNTCIDAVERAGGRRRRCCRRRRWTASWRPGPTRRKHQGDFRTIVAGRQRHAWTR